MSSSTTRSVSPPHSAPMAIPVGRGGHHGRQRSDSTASDSSDGTPPPMTPLNTFGARAPGPSTSPTSPIMNMLAGTAPLKSPTAYPFTKISFSSAVDDEDVEPPVVRHARRTSMTSSSRFVPAYNTPAFAGSQQERGANVLRRLSLGGTFGRVAPEKPPTPPRGPVEPAIISSGPAVVAPASPKRRRGTMPAFDDAASSPPRPRRAPSPMGERILKGHFDSFH